MTIQYFADQQNLVFVPALGALLVATVLICLPIVFAPTLRRARRGRLRLVGAVAGVLAVVALVVAGFQGGAGLRTLQAERAATSAALQQRYGLGLTDGQVGELVNGGRPEVARAELASELRLRRTKDGAHPLRLVAEQGVGDEYRLTYGGAEVPAR